MGSMGCPETSVDNHEYTLRNNPEEWKPRVNLLPVPGIFVRLACSPVTIPTELSRLPL
jgi:hypothetical protein